MRFQLYSSLYSASPTTTWKKGMKIRNDDPDVLDTFIRDENEGSIIMSLISQLRCVSLLGRLARRRHDRP